MPHRRWSLGKESIGKLDNVKIKKFCPLKAKKKRINHELGRNICKRYT